jgi:hypothetical protein
VRWVSAIWYVSLVSAILQSHDVFREALSQCPIGLKRVTYGLHAYDPVDGECEYQLQLRRLWFVFYHVPSTDGHHSCHFLFPVSFGVKHRFIAGHTFMLQASFC